jgi:hypothetical protein
MSYEEFIKDLTASDPENEACLTTQDTYVLYEEYKRDLYN